jgi:hypothetical protein
VGAELASVLPDMTKYGEGNPGVWSVVLKNVLQAVGRSFKLTEPDDLEWLAASRAAGRPALEPGLVAHLGDLYAGLKGHGPVAHGPAREDYAAAAGATPGSDGPAGHVAVLSDTSLENLDWRMDESALSPELRDRMAQLDDKTARARRAAAAGDAIEASLPDLPPEKIAARERWDIGAQETGPLPPELHDRLIARMTGGGASAREMSEEMDISRHTVNNALNRLRFEGKARVVGKGRVARWMITAEADTAEAGTQDGGDGQ